MRKWNAGRLFYLLVACLLVMVLIAGCDRGDGNGNGSGDDLLQLEGDWFGFWWISGSRHPAIIEFSPSSSGLWTGSVTMTSHSGPMGYPTYGSFSLSGNTFQVVDEISPATFTGQVSPGGNILSGYDEGRNDWIVARDGIELSESEPCSEAQYEACEYRGFFCDHGYCNICQSNSCQNICCAEGCEGIQGAACAADCVYDSTTHCPL